MNECVTYEAVYFYIKAGVMANLVCVLLLGISYWYRLNKQARVRQEHYQRYEKKRQENENHFNQVKAELDLMKRKRER